MTPGLQLGRPGVYAVSQREDRSLKAVRLDVAGFVGVAMRGPVDRPVSISSWSDYERRFGGFERPDNAPDRLLPFAVQAFFAQGGVRAYVNRVAPPPGFRPSAIDATARYNLAVGSESWEIAASNEGLWGNDMIIRLEFEVGQTFTAAVRQPGAIELPAGAKPAVWSLLRIRRPDKARLGDFRWLASVPDEATGSRVARLDSPLPELREGESAEVEVGVVTGVLVVSDRSSALPREERLSGLGLRPGHPRFLGEVLGWLPGDTAAESESLLVRAAGSWDRALTPDRFLSPATADLVVGKEGSDRSYGINFKSFFDDGEASDDLLDEKANHRGVDRMGRVSEIGILCIPDLTWSAQPPAPDPGPSPVPSKPHPCFPCAPKDEIPEADEPELIPIGLDARAPEDLEEITRRQVRAVQVAELRRRFVLLLDVPRGVQARRIERWRAQFDSSYAAAYYPWLGVPRPARSAADRPAAGVQSRSPDEGKLVYLAPSAFAAGVVASRERRLGLAWGPANEIARGAVASADDVTDELHDQLHLLGVNVFRAERDGFGLTAARTLSTNPDYRQLSIRRLMTMLALTLERQVQWLVFEPNTSELRERLTHCVVQFLRDLHRRGFFAGATEAESFFVACDDTLNSQSSQRQGRLLTEVGVAPASPLEYLLLRITRDVDGSLAVESPVG